MVGEFSPDLVLLDLEAPGQGGIEIGRELRRMVLPREPALVASTGWISQAAMRDCASAGFDHFLIKPVAAEEIAQLQRADHDRDAGGEAGGDRIGDELDQLPEACQPHEHQDDAGHERRGEQSAQAVAGGDRRQDGDEGGGGAGHLQPGAAERGIAGGG